jgi:hypothetical protein
MLRTMFLSALLYLSGCAPEIHVLGEGLDGLDRNGGATSTPPSSGATDCVLPDGSIACGHRCSVAPVTGVEGCGDEHTSASCIDGLWVCSFNDAGAPNSGTVCSFTDGLQSCGLPCDCEGSGAGLPNGGSAFCRGGTWVCDIRGPDAGAR